MQRCRSFFGHYIKGIFTSIACKNNRNSFSRKFGRLTIFVYTICIYWSRFSAIGKGSTFITAISFTVYIINFWWYSGLSISGHSSTISNYSIFSSGNCYLLSINTIYNNITVSINYNILNDKRNGFLNLPALTFTRKIFDIGYIFPIRIITSLHHTTNQLIIGIDQYVFKLNCNFGIG
ncbi:hypothetical protein D3C85_1063610 [compost metagenome]